MDLVMANIVVVTWFISRYWKVVDFFTWIAYNTGNWYASMQLVWVTAQASIFCVMGLRILMIFWIWPAFY